MNPYQRTKESKMKELIQELIEIGMSTTEAELIARETIEIIEDSEELNRAA
jgi:uncharacterized protein YoaH (UPF0181 family)